MSQLTLLGVGWLSIAALLAYLSVATPLLDRVVLSRLDGASVRLLGVVAAAIVPAALGTAGIVRLATAIRLAAPTRRTALARAVAELGGDFRVIAPVTLEDGRILPQVLVGPCGAVAFRELEHGARFRQVRGDWQIEVGSQWLPVEDPLERTARDAQALRQALRSRDADFVVHVHAALVTAADIARLPDCAVLQPDQIASYVAALPPQRTLTPRRIDAIVGLLQGR